MNMSFFQMVIQKWLGLHPAYAKWIIALLGLIGQVANMAILHGTAQHDLVVGLGALTALGVRVAPNAGSAPATP